MNHARLLLPLLLAVIFGGANLPRASATLPDSLLQNPDGRSVLVYANRVAQADFEEAMLAFGLAEKRARAAQDALLLCNVFRDKGLFWEDRSRLDSAAAMFGLALQVAERQKLAPETRTVLNDLAIISRKRARYVEARDYHLRAIEMAQAENDAETVEYSWHGLGFLYESVGDHEQALANYQRSFEEAQRRDHKNGMMVTLGNLAEMRASIGKKDGALADARQGLALAAAERDTEQIAQLLFILADVFDHFGQTDSATVYFQKCLPWCRSAHEWTREAQSLLRLGELAEARRDFSAAQKHYAASLSSHADLLPAVLVAEAYLRLGKLAQMRGGAAGLEHLLQSLGIATQNHLTEAEIAANRQLNAWYLAQNRPETALACLERADFLSDSLAESQRKQGDAELNFRFGLEERRRAAQEMELHQRQTRNAVLIAIGLLMVGGLGYSINLRRRTTAALRDKNTAIRAQNTRLEESNTHLTQFTYAVAHDLKEPLRSISSFISLLERRHKNEFDHDGLGYMQFVQNGVKRMHALIDDLLKFSKVSSQRPGTNPVDPKKVLDSAISLLQKDFPAKNNLIEYPSALPSVRMDAAHLSLLFQHLIHNGLKFNHSEMPKVSINAHVDSGTVLFSFEDNGIGIDREHGKKVFELFHQLHKNKDYGGTGVGLTMVKNIVDKYNGYIWFEPASPRGGTRFWVGLPSAS